MNVLFRRFKFIKQTFRKKLSTSVEKIDARLSRSFPKLILKYIP